MVINPDLSGDGIDVVYQCFSGYHFAHGMKDHIHRYNRLEGTTRLISTRYYDNAKANGGHWNPRISGDGRYSVFTGTASNMVPGDSNRVADIFLHDNDTNKISRLSEDATGVEADGPSDKADISYDGRFVVFITKASNLTTDSIADIDQVILLDRQKSRLTRIAAGVDPAISDDGQWVSFTSPADGGTGLTDVYLYSLADATLTHVNESANGSSYASRLNDDGRFVTFSSRATNLDELDSDNLADVYLFDRLSGSITLVSTDGSDSASHAAVEANISTDGQTLVFASEARNLVEGDTNLTADIFAANVVSDNEPPQIFASLSQDTLWPPNKKMVDIVIEGDVIDNVGVIGVSIVISDEYGEFDGMQLDGFGPFQLRAYRDGGDRDGRQYQLTITALDAAGNSSLTELPILVPHNMGKKKK